MRYDARTRRCSYKFPALNYSMDACGLSEDICPAAGQEVHCPCAIGGSITRCDTLACSQPGGDLGGTCDEFVYSTVGKEKLIAHACTEE